MQHENPTWKACCATPIGTTVLGAVWQSCTSVKSESRSVFHLDPSWSNSTVELGFTELFGAAPHFSLSYFHILVPCVRKEVLGFFFLPTELALRRKKKALVRPARRRHDRPRTSRGRQGGGRGQPRARGGGRPRMLTWPAKAWARWPRRDCATAGHGSSRGWPGASHS